MKSSINLVMQKKKTMKIVVLSGRETNDILVYCRFLIIMYIYLSISIERKRERDQK